MIEPNENIFKYVQAKHISGMLSGLIGAMSAYIDPEILREAVRSMDRTMSDDSLMNHLKGIYRHSEPMRTDYEKD